MFPKLTEIQHVLQLRFQRLGVVQPELEQVCQLEGVWSQPQGAGSESGQQHRPLHVLSAAAVVPAAPPPEEVLETMNMYH